MRRAALSILCLLAPAALLAQTRFSGQVLDRESGRPAADARIILLESGASAYADAQGRFELSAAAPGLYTLRILIGDRQYQLRQAIRYDGEVVQLAVGAARTPEIAENAGADGITIIGRRDRTRLSRFTLNQDEIRRLPGVYGDSLRAIETLPGVAPAQPIGVLPTTNLLTGQFIAGFGGPPYRNSESGFLVMRGAGSRANQFLLDGFKIQYPFHLGDQSSVVNNQYIRSVDVYTGTYPVRFGNATGGVISIEGPEEIKEHATNLNVSLFKSDVYYQQPLFGGAWSFVGSARQSYPNYVLLQAYPEAIPPNAKFANYQDGQFRLSGKIGAAHSIDIIYFGARDILDYTKSVAELSSDESSSPLGGVSGATGAASGGGFNTNSDTRPPVGLDRGFHTQGLRYTFTDGGWLRNELRLQTSRFREDFDLDFRSPFTGETIFGFQVLDARREFQVRNDVTVALYEQSVALNAGVEHNDVRWELSLRNFSPQSSLNPDTPSFVDVVNDLVENNRTFRSLFDGDRTKYTLDGAYAELEAEFWRLRLTPGVRGDWYSLSNSAGFGPRMGAEFRIPETGSTLLAGAGRHFNAPTSLNYVSEEAGNPWLKMEEADRMAVGLEQELGPAWLLKVEGFRNQFRNLVVEDPYLVIPFSPRLNRRELASKPLDVARTPYENRFLGFSNDGEGFSAGFEIYLKRVRPPRANGLFGWISYTNSIAKRNNHQTRLTEDEQDRRTAANAARRVVGYYEAKPWTLLYYDTGELETLYDNDRQELYDLDQTNILSLVLNYKFSDGWQVGSRFRYADNTPYTPITGANRVGGGILGRSTFLPEYSAAYNSARLRPFHQLDIRVDRFLNYSWGYVNYYLELINVYGRRNEEEENFDIFYPYVRGTNPAPSYESSYIETPTGKGRRVLLPLINLGVEVRF